MKALFWWVENCTANWQIDFLPILFTGYRTENGKKWKEMVYLQITTVWLQSKAFVALKLSYLSLWDNLIFIFVFLVTWVLPPQPLFSEVKPKPRLITAGPLLGKLLPPCKFLRWEFCTIILLQPKKKVSGLLATVSCHHARGGIIGPMRKKRDRKVVNPFLLYVFCCSCFSFHSGHQAASLIFINTSKLCYPECCWINSTVMVSCVRSKHGALGLNLCSLYTTAPPSPHASIPFFAEDISISYKEQMAPVGKQAALNRPACFPHRRDACHN